MFAWVFHRGGIGKAFLLAFFHLDEKKARPTATSVQNYIIKKYIQCPQVTLRENLGCSNEW